MSDSLAWLRADVALWTAWHKADAATEDAGACGARAKVVKAPVARESHAQELPSARGGACRV